MDSSAGPVHGSNDLIENMEWPGRLPWPIFYQKTHYLSNKRADSQPHAMGHAEVSPPNNEKRPDGFYFLPKGWVTHDCFD
jgi:hypothetical protein